MSKHRTGIGVSPQWYQEKRHKEAVARKYERIQGLRALLEMWEERPDEAGHEYILQLRAKLRSAEQNLAAMTL